MKRRSFLKNTGIVSASFMVPGGTVLSFDRNENIHFRGYDNNQALINPMMGWTLYFYSHSPGRYGDTDLAPSDDFDDFPGISSIYMRLPWDLLEPEEGQFNWTVFDTPAQRWIQRGKQIAIRITCSESWHKWATPKWVYDAGAKGYFYDDDKPGVINNDGELWEPDFNDPVYLEKLGNFLKAFAGRYDNNPHVAYIDIGSFGLWGEGHTLGTRKQYSLDVKKKHIDLYRTHFRNTLLALSDDIAGATAPGTHFEITDYALSQGVTLRDDSILVSTKRPYFHTELMSLFWPQLPVIIEHEHYDGSKQRGAWSGDKLYNSVMDYHASYMSIQASPYVFLQENRDTINRINSKLGYRIMVSDINMPKNIWFNQPFRFVVKLGNTAVAPCYPGGYICLTIKDRKEAIIGVFVNESFSIQQLKPAGKEAPEFHTLESVFTIRKLVNGLTAPTQVPVEQCKAYISIGSHDGTPQIELPLNNGDGRKRYFIDTINIISKEK